MKTRTVVMFQIFLCVFAVFPVMASLDLPLALQRAKYLQSTWNSDNGTEGLICALSGDFIERKKVIEIFDNIQETNLAKYVYEHISHHFGHMMAVLTENPHARINAYLIKVASFSEGPRQTDETTMDDALLTIESQEDMDAMKAFYLKHFHNTADSTVYGEAYDELGYMHYLMAVLHSSRRYSNETKIDKDEARKIVQNCVDNRNEATLGLLAKYMADLNKVQLTKFEKLVESRNFRMLMGGEDDLSTALRSTLTIASNKPLYFAHRFNDYYAKVRRTDTDDWKFYMSPGALLPRLTKDEIRALDREYRNLHNQRRWITGDIENGYSGQDERVKKMLLALMGAYTPKNCPVPKNDEEK